MTRRFTIEYASGVAEAERLMASEGKAIGYTSTPIPIGGQDGANLRTNTVTTVTAERYEDGRMANADNAIGIAAAWACVNLLAGTIASLPLMVYRTDYDGTRTVAKTHPLYWLLHDSPNYDQTAVDFWEFMAAALELHGNAYARMQMRASDGLLTALTPIRPDIVTVQRVETGELRYSWYENGQLQRVGQSEMLHIRGFGGNPLGGASTLSACRQTFGAALATERTSAAFFANGVRPSGVITTDKMLTAEQRKELEARLQEKFAGAMKAGRPMLLDNGTKWESLTINPDDAQMLESRRFSVEEVCRVFGVPPHMIGHTENSTSWGTGLEQQTLGFTKFTLRRRLKRIEQALQKQLLSLADQKNGITIEFNIEGLLRGDSKGRADFYKIMTGIGAFTINEVRKLENLPPVAGGDVPMVQMQDVPLSEAINQAQTRQGGNGGGSTPSALPAA